MKTQKTSTRITRKAAKTADLLTERKPKRQSAAKPKIQSSPSAKSAAKPTTKKRTLKIPSILLEGDRPAPPPIRGPGQRYALGAQPPTEKFQAPQVELPEAYGT